MRDLRNKNMKKLFAVYLGGKFQDTFIEDHEIIFVVASDKDEAKKIAKSKSRITIDIHADGIIENVDGYHIVLEKRGNQKITYDNTYSQV
jgi:hypothetical protein